MTRQEPSRSRALIVAGGVLAAVGVMVTVWAAGTRSWWFAVVLGAWLLALVTIGVVTIVASVRAMGGAARLARPMRFGVTRGGFGVGPLIPAWLTAVPPMLLSGFMTAMLAGLWRQAVAGDPDPARSALDKGFATLMTALVAMIILLAVVTVVFAWRGLVLELTPAGLSWRGPLFRRTVPWEALAPGGPPRPRLDADRLHLAVTQPDLVVQRGLALGFGPRQHPAVALQVAVHPWFLADAIRWYAEHPEHRAAIGTDAEHQRLITELATAAPEHEQPAGASMPRPPRPRAVTVAAGLTYAAVAVGLVAAATNLVVAIVFGEQLTAAEHAMNAEEQRITGEPVGETLLNAAEFARAWTIGGLVLAAVAGIAAVALARATARGNDHARTGLITLAALVGVWAVCPCGSPTLDLPDTTGVIMLLLWLLERGALLALGATVIVLLRLPTANRYFRPPTISQA
ncbi:hypothetical protein GCM10010170_075370 [Dactylosporangium salmoneum]|uniref:Integral membrane protein n=1 Tax=Dactylosporangium salmoneum TaxID=53361 RepID=A0ABN3H934_9ACTN